MDNSVSQQEVLQSLVYNQYYLLHLIITYRVNKFYNNYVIICVLGNYSDLYQYH